MRGSGYDGVKLELFDWGAGLPPKLSLDGAPNFPGDWAQVAERLMAADCKSATHSSYGGSNPPLCTIKAVVSEQFSVISYGH